MSIKSIIPSFTTGWLPQIKVVNPLSRFIPSFSSSPPASNYRRVFQTTDQMKSEFEKFLKTIFYQLDEKKVFAAMEKILEDPNKTDEQVYTELLSQVGGMKKRFAPLWQIWSLGVLKKGMGQQAAELLKNFRPSNFHDYMEIYDRRYLNTIRKAAGLALDGRTIAVCNSPSIGIVDRLTAGALFSSYPYKTHVSLNDPDCKDPLMHPEQAYKPLGDEVPDQSVDLIACLGGLHHTSRERIGTFAASMSKKLRPGAVLLIRDHNVANASGVAKLPKDDLRALVSVVHTFVNASDGVSPEVEKKEIRDFKSMTEWTEILKKHHFTRVSPELLVLKDDPTENGMTAFVRNPQNLDEMREAIQYRNDCTRGKDGTRATWIEWGNVRFSKQYAEFVQTHHSYAFDYVGHLRQHWQYVYHYIKESLNDGVGLFNLIFSDNFAMNLFILLIATVQCTTGQLVSLPSMLVARWQDGPNWRSVSNLTDLEKYAAQVEKEYSSFIDHTPFYMFDHIGKIKQLWRVVIKSQESWATKITSALNAISWSAGLLLTAAISAPVRAIYTSEANVEPDTIKVLIKDPNNELRNVIKRWEKEKDAQVDKNCKIEEIYTTPDGYKLVSLPRYRPFTKICGYMTQTSKLELLEIGSQKGIAVDVLLNEGVKTPEINGARVVYEMDRLQDPEHRRYATYQVGVKALQGFLKQIGNQHIEYIHE